MNKFTKTAKSILKGISGFSLNSYEHAKLFTSQVHQGGFSFAFHTTWKLINEGYSSNTDVYAIVSKIIRTGANIPYKIVNIADDGTEEVITSGAFYDSVMHPNKRQNKFEFTEDALGYQLITGNEMLTGMVPAGFKMITKVNIIPPQIVSIKKMGSDLFDYSIKYLAMWKGKEITFAEEDVKHIKYFNPTNAGLDTGMGLSPLQAAYKTLENSNELMTAGASALKNRGANGLLSAEGDNPLSAEESDDLQETTNKRLGEADKFNRVVATTARVKYTQFGLSPSDLKMIENGVLTLRQLCNIWGASSSMFNDPANKRFSNEQEGTKSFYVNAVLPPLERHLAGYKELIIAGWNEADNANYDIRLDLSEIDALQSDQNKRVEKQTKLSAGITSVLMRVGENKITPESAIRILSYSYEMSEEEATAIISNTTNSNTQTNE